MLITLPKNSFYIPDQEIFIRYGEKEENRFMIMTSQTHVTGWEIITFKNFRWVSRGHSGSFCGDRDPFASIKIPVSVWLKGKDND
jgi:hypothetical protein